MNFYKQVALNTRESRLPLHEGVAHIHGHHQLIVPSHEDLQRAEKDLNSILIIKAYLGGVRAIQETLEVADCKSRLCKWVLEKCGEQNTAPVVDLIENAIEQHATYSKTPIDIRNNRLWAVKVRCSRIPMGIPALTDTFHGRPSPKGFWNRLASSIVISQKPCMSTLRTSTKRFKVRTYSTSQFGQLFAHRQQNNWAPHRSFDLRVTTTTISAFNGLMLTASSRNPRAVQEAAMSPLHTHEA